MRLAYGEGVLVAILVPFIVYLLGIGKFTILETLFSVFALVGLWTIISAFVLMRERDRVYFFTWGLIVLSISSAFVVHIQYSIALILIAIIAALLFNVATRDRSTRSPKISYNQSNSGGSPSSQNFVPAI